MLWCKIHYYRFYRLIFLKWGPDYGCLLRLMSGLRSRLLIGQRAVKSLLVNLVYLVIISYLLLLSCARNEMVRIPVLHSHSKDLLISCSPRLRLKMSESECSLAAQAKNFSSRPTDERKATGLLALKLSRYVLHSVDLYNNPYTSSFFFFYQHTLVSYV